MKEFQKKSCLSKIKDFIWRKICIKVQHLRMAVLYRDIYVNFTLKTRELKVKYNYVEHKKIIEVIV